MLFIENLSIRNQKNILFENFNLSLDSKSQKKIALLGINGSGKSSLLKVILSKQDNFTGKIDIKNERIFYMDQHPTFPQEEMVGIYLENKIDFQHEFYQIEIALEKVNLDQDILYKVFKDLSEGQKIKIKLAEILLHDPTILLLDEPTNHLDQASIDFIGKFILDFPGSIILISHQKEILNTAINEIWEIRPSHKDIKIFKGNFDYWWDHRHKTIQKDQKDSKKIEVEITEIKKWLKANEFHPKYRFSSFVGNQKKKLAQLEKQLQQIIVQKDPSFKIQDKSLTNNKKQLIFNQEVYEKKIKLFKGQKILISGPNGSGKTTLMNKIKDELGLDQQLRKDKIKISHLNQITEIKQSIKVEKYLSKNLLVDQKVLFQKINDFQLKHLLKTNVENLSGGEKKRLELVEIFSQENDILLFDEPTNHLDIFSQIEIIDFIKESSKTIILISHDKFLLEHINFDQEIRLQ